MLSMISLDKFSLCLGKKQGVRHLFSSFKQTTANSQAMNNINLTADQTDQELSMDDLSSVNGGGPVAVAGWTAFNAFTLAIPAMIDLAHGSPHAKEALESKY